MKKLITICLMVFALPPLANATMMYYGAGSGVTYDGNKYVVQAGTMFTIQVTADIDTSFFSLNIKSNNHTTTRGTINSDFGVIYIPGTQQDGLQVADLMIFKINGTDYPNQTVPKGQVLYSFTANAGTTIGQVWTFDSMDTNGGHGPIIYTKINNIPVTMPQFAVKVIPEPATLLLFGLGAVMLRRKN